MKGFYIYEVESRIGTVVDCLELGDIDNTFTQEFAPGTITEEVKMHALVSKGTKSKCSKEDAYDFETGALISLMKMCGQEKVTKACEELYRDKKYKNKLQETTDCLNDLSKRYDGVVRYCDSLREANKGLQEEKEQIIVAKNILYNKLEKENKELKGNIDELFESEQHTKSELGRLYFEKHRLEEENEKLKLDCEKLQHGYNDIDNVPSGHWDGDILDIVFLPGRACGKQYKTLVEMFKKIDQKKVDEAYKEAYNTTLPVWQKEFLRQAYEIRKESKEKTELPRTLDINGTVYRKSIQIKDFGEEITKLAEESSTKPAFTIDHGSMMTGFGPSNLFTISKREKMWDDILKEGRTPVWVKREDIHDFLEECQTMGIKWSSGKLPLETMPFHMTDGYEGAYFFVHTSLDISKSKHGAKEFRHVMTWWATACPEEVEAAIHYIRPMRWDLFEKGRIVIKVEKESYGEFCSRMLSHFDKVGVNAFNHTCKFGYFAFNKDTRYVERILSSDCGQTKEINRRKVVDWEDVR